MPGGRDPGQRTGRPSYRPWHHRPDVAHLGLLPEHGVGPSTLNALLEEIAAAGYRSVLTGAMSPRDAVAFLTVGFAVRDRLMLLRRDLRRMPDPMPPGPRRGGRGDLDAVLDVDHRAFVDPVWQFDQAMLLDALDATPTSVLHVVDGPGDDPLGYAVHGVAGTTGYLQRLAVDPGSQRVGLGSALVTHGLRWMRRHGATTALVNTQQSNAPARKLYARLGFTPRREELVVLERPVAPAMTTPR